MNNLNSRQFEWAVIGLVVLLLAACIASCVGFGLFAVNQECKNVSDIMGLTVQWRVFGGCFVEIEEGTYIPLADYHYVQGIKP